MTVGRCYRELVSGLVTVVRALFWCGLELSFDPGGDDVFEFRCRGREGKTPVVVLRTHSDYEMRSGERGEERGMRDGGGE